MRFDLIQCGAATGIDWSAASALRDCDPYLVWADASSQSPAEDPKVSLLIELRTASDRAHLPSELKLTHIRLFFGYRFLTATMPLKALHLLSKLVGGAVLRFTLLASRHRAKQKVPAKAPISKLSELATESAGAVWLRQRFRPMTAGIAPPALLGVIDDGCPVGHERFWHADGPAVVTLWHQGRREEQTGAPRPADGAGRQQAPRPDPYAYYWRDPGMLLRFPGMPSWIPTFFYGDELALREHATYQRRSAEGRPPLRGPMSHTATGYPRRPPHWTHGAAVLGLAAADAAPQLAADACRARRAAVARRPLVFVQLPEMKVDDTSFGSLAGHVLDGIHYTLLQAAPAQPVVVNVSYGHHAGPHDGTSMFEQATAELLEKNLLLDVVIAAGNSHLARCHAFSFVPAKRTRRLRWRVLPDNPEDSFLELWFDGDVTGTTLSVFPPGSSEPLKIGHGKAGVWNDSGVLRCGAVFAPRVAQGRHGTMALLIVAPTQRLPVAADGGAPIRMAANVGTKRRSLLGLPGVWRVEVTNGGTADVGMHAWVERDDVAPGRSFRGRSVARQSYLLDGDCDPDAVPVRPEATLNGAATLVHARFHVVGAMSAWDGCLADASAAGPNRSAASGGRCEGPDVVTIGDESRRLRGLRTTGQVAGATARVGGTSIAAAVYSQMLAEHRSTSASSNAKFLRPCWDFATPTWPRFPGQPALASPLLRGECLRVFPPGIAPRHRHQR